MNGARYSCPRSRTLFMESLNPVVVVEVTTMVPDQGRGLRWGILHHQGEGHDQGPREGHPRGQGVGIVKGITMRTGTGKDHRGITDDINHQGKDTVFASPRTSRWINNTSSPPLDISFSSSAHHGHSFATSLIQLVQGMNIWFINCQIKINWRLYSLPLLIPKTEIILFEWKLIKISKRICNL